MYLGFSKRLSHPLIEFSLPTFFFKRKWVGFDDNNIAMVYFNANELYYFQLKEQFLSVRKGFRNESKD